MYVNKPIAFKKHIEFVFTAIPAFKKLTFILEGALTNQKTLAAKKEHISIFFSKMETFKKTKQAIYCF